MSFAILDHTVLPAIRLKWIHRALTPVRSQYSIYISWKDGRRSWPGWLVTYQDGLPACRQPAIQVLTPGLSQTYDCWSQVRRPNHYIAQGLSIILPICKADSDTFLILLVGKHELY